MDVTVAAEVLARLAEEVRQLEPGQEIRITYHDMRRFNCYTLAAAGPGRPTILITDGEPMKRWPRGDATAFARAFYDGLGRLLDDLEERRRVAAEQARLAELQAIAADLDQPLPMINPDEGY